MIWPEQHRARYGKVFESRTKRPNLYCSRSCRQIAYMTRNHIKVKKDLHSGALTPHAVSALNSAPRGP
jgi:hypothetical protein